MLMKIRAAVLPVLLLTACGPRVGEEKAPEAVTPPAQSPLYVDPSSAFSAMRSSFVPATTEKV